MFVKCPVASPGQRIGLLGGSFDPAHEGHVHITRWALRAFDLDQVWWLVSPGNPLKTNGPAPLADRMAIARRVMRHPRVVITDIETRLGTRYTADTLDQLLRRNRNVRFIWLMGADNLAVFHEWERWGWIFENVPIGVMARPGEQLRAGLSRAAQRYARWRRPQSAASGIGRAQTPLLAPDWSLITGPMSPLSSTAIRAGHA